MLAYRLQLLLVLLAATGGALAAKQPNILFVVADDLGWNDIGWHNPRMKTPNLDTLAQSGVIFNQSYIQQLCTPSRTAFMTAYYPYHLGRQHGVLLPEEPTGVTLNVEMLPEVLKQHGYRTHMVGKWHLGYCDWRYTPTFRGFDSHFGYYLGMQDYYNHSREYNGSWGLDFRDNQQADRNLTGVYSAMAFTARAVKIIENHDAAEAPLFLYMPFQSVHGPLQVPERFEKMYANIKDTNRRIYCGMVSALDEAIGNVTKALKKKGIFNDTLIVFTADNGGEVYSGGNNWPLRGNKNTLWEGGTRGAAFASGAGIRKTGYVSSAIIHAVDWMPTLLASADIGFNDTQTDGKNQWLAVSAGLPSSRTEFVYNIDEVDPAGAAIRVGDYKLLVGYPGKANGWYPEPSLSKRGAPNSAWKSKEQSAGADKKRGSSQENVTQEKVEANDYPDFLFNLAEDPEERVNLAKRLPQVLATMKARLEEYRRTLQPADDLPPDPNADPRHWHDTYSPGWCDNKGTDGRKP